MVVESNRGGEGRRGGDVVGMVHFLGLWVLDELGSSVGGKEGSKSKE